MKVLDGVRVLELSQYIAGPICGCILADHGAEVVKVEPPGGEASRQLGPFVNDESIYFAVFNRNKLGITVDLQKPEGRGLFLSLAKTSDIVIENFRPGVMDKLGLGYASLAAANPRVVLVSVSGFGQEGPYRDMPAFDPILQALSGLMYLNGNEGDPPLKSAMSIADYSAGINGAMGALLAIIGRERTGVGQHVDVSLFDSLVFMLETSVATYRATGELPPRVGNDRPWSSPGSAYQCADGWVYVAPTGDGIWRRFAVAMGKPELLDDPRFTTNVARVAHRAELNLIIGDWCASRAVEEVLVATGKGGVPASEVKTIADLVDDPQARLRKMLVELDHSRLGRHTVPGVPIKLLGSASGVDRPAPCLGEHTEQVLRSWLGLDATHIADLKSAGAV